ncbi:MAG: hypothetical protein LBH28_05980 [Oscillospiraceae bacterium]|jgi:hypothetical protein|nr:hypothetical protein [Oscillospiraceae bacterium]
MSKDKAGKSRAEVLEFIVVIMLGITAIATAWSSWQGSLHGSQMAQKYTRSNNIASEGNSEYNAGIQTLTQDMMLYNEINSLMIDLHFAESNGDSNEAEKLEWKIDELVSGNMSEELAVAFQWAMDEAIARNESVSPFEMEGFVDTYFEIANELLAESAEMLDAGNANNTHGDNQGLVSVIYAVVLFMLGISSSFKGLREKCVLLAVSGLGFIGATAFMFTIPIVMP